MLPSTQANYQCIVIRYACAPVSSRTRAIRILAQGGLFGGDAKRLVWLYFAWAEGPGGGLRQALVGADSTAPPTALRWRHD